MGFIRASIHVLWTYISNWVTMGSDGVSNLPSPGVGIIMRKLINLCVTNHPVSTDSLVFPYKIPKVIWSCCLATPPCLKGSIMWLATGELSEVEGIFKIGIRVALFCHTPWPDLAVTWRWGLRSGPPPLVLFYVGKSKDNTLTETAAAGDCV